MGATVTLNTPLESLIIKKVGPIKKGQAGVVYLPKALIGQKVIVIANDTLAQFNEFCQEAEKEKGDSWKSD